jgi:hypothetical protein
MQRRIECDHKYIRFLLRTALVVLQPQNAY